MIETELAVVAFIDDLTMVGRGQLGHITFVHINTIQEDHQGRDWDCYVTVHGTIDLMTGMVTDIGVLDRLVQDRIIKPFDRQDLRKVLGSETVRGEALAKTIWDCLAGHLSGGTLHNVRLVQTRDLSFDYAG